MSIPLRMTKKNLLFSTPIICLYVVVFFLLLGVFAKGAFAASDDYIPDAYFKFYPFSKAYYETFSGEKSYLYDAVIGTEYYEVEFLSIVDVAQTSSQYLSKKQVENLSSTPVQDREIREIKVLNTSGPYYYVSLTKTYGTALKGYVQQEITFLDGYVNEKFKSVPLSKIRYLRLDK